MASRRSSYSIKEKERMIKILQDNLHLDGPNQGKPNFYKVSQEYPEYCRSMLQRWYKSKEKYIKSTHKKTFQIDLFNR